MVLARSWPHDCRQNSLEFFVKHALIVAAGLSLTLGACAYNESLGRNQFLIVDDSALIQQSNAPGPKP